MYQTSIFIGRDPMEWWIGQVTDPKKGKWDNTFRKKNIWMMVNPFIHIDVVFVLLDIMEMMI